MKKVVTIILTLILIMAFSSCGGNTEKATDGDKTTDTEILEIDDVEIAYQEEASDDKVEEEQDSSTQEERLDSKQPQTTDTEQEHGASQNLDTPKNTRPTTTASAHTHNWVAVTVHHEAEYKTVHHDAVQHHEQQLVTAAWDENVLVSEAWDEEVWETHYICAGCGHDFGTTPPPIEHISYHMDHDEASNYYSKGVLARTVHHDAVYQTVHHNAVYQTVWVTDKAAWDEKVLVKAAWDETYYKCSVCGAKK